MVLRQGASPFDRVLQFAHVAGPVVGTEHLHRLTRDLKRLAGSWMDFIFEEMGYKQWDVIPPLVQTWQMNGNDIEPVVEVFPESPFFNPFFQA